MSTKSLLFAEPKKYYVFQTEKGLKTPAIALNLGEMARVVHCDVKRFRVVEGLPPQGTSVLVQVASGDEAIDKAVYQEFLRASAADGQRDNLPSFEDLAEWNFCVPAGIAYELTTDSDGSQWVEVRDCDYFTDPCSVDEDGVMHPLE